MAVIFMTYPKTIENVSSDECRSFLTSQGLTEEEITEAFRRIGKPIVSTEDSSKSIVRESQVSAVVELLKAPVFASARDQDIKVFLASKGFTEDEITEAFRRKVLPQFLSNVFMVFLHCFQQIHFSKQIQKDHA